MEAVEKKIVKKKMCKNCKNYVRKNAETGFCTLMPSTAKSKKVHEFVNRDNNWTCDKFIEVN